MFRHFSAGSFVLVPSRLLAVLMALLAVATWSGLAADDPPAKQPTPEQKEQLKALQAQAEEHDRAGRIKEAVAALEKVLALERSAFGDASKQAIESREYLARLHERQGAFAAALEERQEVLDLRTKQHGDKHWQTTDARLDLEYTRLKSRLSAAQRQLLKEALALRYKAVSASERGKHEEAIDATRRALELDRQVLGSKHHIVSYDYGKLASLHAKMWELGTAEAFAQLRLEIVQAVHGEDHPEFADAHNALGQIASDRRHTEAAFAHYHKAAEVWKKAYGEKSFHYSAAVNNLALLHDNTGDFKKAEELYRESLAIKEAAGGAGFATTLSNLGSLLLKAEKRFDEAEALFLRALALREKTLGKDAPDVLITLGWLATLSRARCDDARSRADFEAAAKHAQALIGWEVRRYGEKHHAASRARALAAQVARFCRTFA